jgi:Mor family transcriptional regulator
MPRINDHRISKGKRNRNEAIRVYFAKQYDAGYRYEVIIEELILKYGLSESTINQIIKEYGNYADNEKEL